MGMIESRHYPNAPITEAIIDIQVSPCADLVFEELGNVRRGQVEEYPAQESTFEATGVPEVRPGISASASAQQKQTGFRFVRSDKQYVWQSRTNGFTLSRLPPYESWEPFRDEARRLWSAYREAIQPAAVTRLAVRYINRIDIPEDSVDLKEYFRTSPEVSPDLPQRLAGFFMQLRIPQDDLHGQALINQTVIAPARDGVVSVVLDIDVYKGDDVPSEEDDIWGYFETLHVRKNAIFEACITEKARELFEQCR